MSNEEFQRMSEKTASDIMDACNELQQDMSRFAQIAYEVHVSISGYVYSCVFISMLENKYEEERFFRLMLMRPIMRIYYRYKYRKFRRKRISCQRDLIHMRIDNKQDVNIITEFDKIDRMHL